MYSEASSLLLARGGYAALRFQSFSILDAELATHKGAPEERSTFWAPALEPPKQLKVFGAFLGLFWAIVLQTSWV